MTRRPLLRGVAPVALVATLGTFARADAPDNQYGLFNQSSTTIVDDFTRLTWQRFAPSQTFTYAAGAAYCASLPPDGVATWRLPSYKELLTLVDEAPHLDFATGSYVAIDPNAFPQTLVDKPYVTSSVFPGPPSGNVYRVDFQFGIAFYEPQSDPFYVRCVHD